MELPGEPQKKSPLQPLLILQQCMGIFVRNFTRLLSDQIYTLSPSFIEIFLFPGTHGTRDAGLADGELPLHQQERVAAELARPEPARLHEGQVPIK